MKKSPRPRRPQDKPAVASAVSRRSHKTADPLRLLVEKVRRALSSKKGEDIVVLKMANVSTVTDYLILCSGLNTPHLRALSDEVIRQLRRGSPPLSPYRHAGSAESEWLVLDYLDFVVHLFTPRLRAYYALERLWKDAPVVR